MRMGDRRLVYVLRSYPRLSQTFILQEILALERLGVGIEIFSMTDPHEAVVQPEVGQVRAPVHYLDGGGRRSRRAVAAEHLRVAAGAPLRYLATAAYVVRRSDLDSGYTTASRVSCFAQAVHLARILQSRPRNERRRLAVHSHFAHDPTLIALLTKRLTGLPYSFTAHARDLYQTPRDALRERVREATAVVTCCRANLEYLERVAPAQRDKLRLIHHGIDLGAFTPAAGGGGDGQAPARIVSVGRLVEKKGFGDLLLACAELKRRGVGFRCDIWGDGPLRAQLGAQARALGLQDEVTFAGACPRAQLVAELGRATVVALTPLVTADGDRDGIPNVLVEAMACGAAVTSTTAGGIPELVIHGRNGLLAEPGDIGAIAANLAALVADSGLRGRLGAAARRTVAADFDLETNTRELARLLDPLEVAS